MPLKVPEGVGEERFKEICRALKTVAGIYRQSESNQVERVWIGRGAIEELATECWYADTAGYKPLVSPKNCRALIHEHGLCDQNGNVPDDVAITILFLERFEYGDAKIVIPPVGDGETAADPIPAEVEILLKEI